MHKCILFFSRISWPLHVVIMLYSIPVGIIKYRIIAIKCIKGIAIGVQVEYN